VPAVTEKERRAAEEAGVRLVTPPALPGFEKAGEHSLLLGVELPGGFRPEIIIGHDRKTGPHALALANSFPGARRVHFIHTRPEDIEWYKDALGRDDAALEAETRKAQQRQLAEGAQLVAAVGPDLYTAAQTLLYTSRARPPVVRVDPGFEIVERPAEPPPEIQCLVLGRAEDFELKGLDIAAAALGNVARRQKVQPPPRLVVRGAAEGTGAELRARLAGLAGGFLHAEVREYTPDVARLRDDILSASLMLMPSRSEGFGLVGLEAIAAATPILVSRRSGLGTLLRARLGVDAEHFLVEVSDDSEATVAEWERRIEATLMNREAAFSRAEGLRRDLAQTLTWANAVSTLEAAWGPLFSERA
jgi:glycosyltransferase involved in cell wall biosynthesis